MRMKVGNMDIVEMSVTLKERNTMTMATKNKVMITTKT